MEYKNKIYLIFFKSLKQEVYLIDALNKKDINAAEQNRVTLLKFANEGLAKLDTIRPFGSDRSLIVACKRVLDFHKVEAEKSAVVQSDYLVKTDEFEKIRKSMESKPANKRTQADVDAYNKAVNDMNAKINASNEVLRSDNEIRTKVLEQYSDTEKKFMDIHVPKRM